MRYIFAILVLLLTAGCQESQSPSDVHQEGNNEMSLSLIRAAEAGDTMEVLRLLDEGAKKIVELLIRHGADVNLPDGKGVTPLRHALDHGYAEMASMLEEAGAKK